MRQEKTNRFNTLIIILTATSILWLVSIKITAQNYDEKAVNLKVLPADTGERDLDKIMGDFNRALGVHCDFCHSDPNDKSVKKNDFAADWNPNKLVARSMIKMVNTINNDLIKEARQFKSGLDGVTCISCHHGSSNIDLIENVMFRTYKKEGIAASLNKYEDLKKQYFGSFTYDFSNRALLNFASLVAAAGKNEDAISVAKRNTELFPDYAISYLFLGNEYAKNGNKTDAVKYYEKVLQIDPKNRNAAQQLKKLIQ